jgi:hypothetical protein
VQRKAYRTGATGAAALLTALLAGCSGGSGDAGQPADSKPGTAVATQAAEPGKYRVLPEACGSVDHGTLDSLLPGIRQMADQKQRDDAYDGEAELTYDTDRKSGCHWSVASDDGTERLGVDFERVVSYDATVSDDAKAQSLFAGKETQAHLPVPSSSAGTPGAGTPGTADVGGAGSAAGSPTPGASTPAGGPSGSGGQDGAADSGPPSGSPSDAASASVDPAEIQPRLLDDLGDEAFLDDELGAAGSSAGQRTVTVAFRTSNVIVTVQYAEQPTQAAAVPDSKELQDKARKVAEKLAGELGD